jgi:hypothetical protein
MIGLAGTAGAAWRFFLAAGLPPAAGSAVRFAAGFLGSASPFPCGRLVPAGARDDPAPALPPPLGGAAPSTCVNAVASPQPISREIRIQELTRAALLAGFGVGRLRVLDRDLRLLRAGPNHLRRHPVMRMPDGV